MEDEVMLDLHIFLLVLHKYFQTAKFWINIHTELWLVSDSNWTSKWIQASWFCIKNDVRLTHSRSSFRSVLATSKGFKYSETKDLHTLCLVIWKFFKMESKSKDLKRKTYWITHSLICFIQMDLNSKTLNRKPCWIYYFLISFWFKVDFDLQPSFKIWRKSHVRLYYSLISFTKVLS